MIKRTDTCYSAADVSQTRMQKHFTILEMAADWHELMIPQHIMQLSIARASEQLDAWCRWCSIQTYHCPTQPH